MMDIAGCAGKGKLQVLREHLWAWIVERRDHVFQCSERRFRGAVHSSKSKVSGITGGCATFINQFVNVGAAHSMECLLEDHTRCIFAFDELWNSLGIVFVSGVSS